MRELPQLRDLKYVSEYFEVHPATVMRWIKEGRLRRVPGMYQIRVTDQAILNFIDAEYGHAENPSAGRPPLPVTRIPSHD